MTEFPVSCPTRAGSGHGWSPESPRLSDELGPVDYLMHRGRVQNYGPGDHMLNR